MQVLMRYDYSSPFHAAVYGSPFRARGLSGTPAFRSFGCAMTLCVFMLSFHCVGLQFFCFMAVAYYARGREARLANLCIAEYITRGKYSLASMKDNGNTSGPFRNHWGWSIGSNLLLILCIRLYSSYLSCSVLVSD